MFNKSQKKFISDQLGTIGSILFAALIVSQFLPNKTFELRAFLINLLITAAVYAGGVIFRAKINE